MARRADDVERDVAHGRDADPHRGGPPTSSTQGRASATTSTCSDVAERYLALVDERAIAIPTGYREHLGQLPRIEAALAVHPPATVPCHNDLLAENYLDDGTRLWLVDWEYSGNNDPAFELGNTAQELGYDEAQVAELCADYYGEASPARLARMHLQMIMSDVGWTLWAAIQAGISTIDYDFTGWAEERWARTTAVLDGPDYESWLGAVQET